MKFNEQLLKAAVCLIEKWQRWEKVLNQELAASGGEMLSAMWRHKGIIFGCAAALSSFERGNPGIKEAAKAKFASFTNSSDLRWWMFSDEQGRFKMFDIWWENKEDMKAYQVQHRRDHSHEGEEEH
jgi:hypothetical protein